MRSRATVGGLAFVVATLAWLSWGESPGRAAITTGAAAPARSGVVEVPVAFRVLNTDTSGAPCNPARPSDGKAYTVRGHLTGPRSALAGQRSSAVTLYLFGYEAGEWNWNLKDVAGYDYAAEMARLGHVSLTIDQLGYGASGHPNGNETCMGSQADVAHQIVSQLRSGSYTMGGRPATAFGSVILAGHDVGGQIAEIEAYSYQDIDALILVTWADQGQTPWIIRRSSEAGLEWCPQTTSGYVHFISEQEYRQLLFYDSDPRVVDATNSLRNPNPCGMIGSAGPSVAVDKLRTSEVRVPVLIVFGADDTLVWTRQGQEQQQDNFTGTADRTTAFVPRAGHFPMLEKTAPEFRNVISSWLASHSGQ
jgi:pimeloyl-ACP methyl ester carboxylesterase